MEDDYENNSICVKQNKKEETKMKIAALVAFMIGIGLNPDTNNTYPMTVKVVDFDYEIDLVTVKDIGSEKVFGFYGIEDWDKGDVISLLMADNATPMNWEDDVILDMRYTGVTLDVEDIILTSGNFTGEDLPVLTCGD